MAILGLPQRLKSFFWDYPFAELTWKNDRELIVRRVLTEGSWDAIVWLWKKMGNDALREWILDKNGKQVAKQVGFVEPHILVNFGKSIVP